MAILGRPTKMGNVYVIGASDAGPVKIGNSGNPQSRLTSIRSGHPERLYVLRSWPHGAAHQIETAVDRALKPLRLHGEWFSIGLQAAADAIEAAIQDYRPDKGAAFFPIRRLPEPTAFEIERERI